VRGGSLVNCVCVVEKNGWEVESWTTPGDYDELKADFAGWHRDIHQLIDNADKDSLYKWALFDRPPMSQWGRDRVTLLGDACHPTLPFMAQGAAMAIEDSAVLAGCLEQGDPVAASLQRYEDLRRSRTAGVQNGSRRNAKMFHLSGIKAWLRNRAVRAGGNRAMEALYSYNPLEVTNS
jgi:salicylate hydroxylase